MLSGRERFCREVYPPSQHKDGLGSPMLLHIRIEPERGENLILDISLIRGCTVSDACFCGIRRACMFCTPTSEYVSCFCVCCLRVRRELRVELSILRASNSLANRHISLGARKPHVGSSAENSQPTPDHLDHPVKTPQSTPIVAQYQAAQESTVFFHLFSTLTDAHHKNITRA